MIVFGAHPNDHVHARGMSQVQALKIQVGQDVALLVNKTTGDPVSWCKAGPGGASHTETAAVRLMQAQSEKPVPADLYLYTTEIPTAMCLGMSKRAHVHAIIFDQASTCHFANSTHFNGASSPLTDPMKLEMPGPGWGQTLSPALELQPVPSPRFRGEMARMRDHGKPVTALRDKIFMTLTFALLHAARNEAADKDAAAVGGQQIAGVLVGPTGRILSWGVNTNNTNATRHGETNCIQSYLQNADGAVPDGCTLYTTLESCDMCAGMLATVAADMRVVYGAKDPGIGLTALTQKVRNSSQEPFLHAGSNPVARANFQRIVAKAVLKDHEDRLREHAKSAKQHYAATHPKPKPAAIPAGTPDPQAAAKLAAEAAGKAYTASQNEFALHEAWRQAGPRSTLPKRYDLSDPSSKITERLAAPGSMNAISTYHKHYHELGMKLLTLRQHRPGADYMGFTLTELREIIARDQKEMPILAAFQPSDFDAWEDGDRLLREVKAGVLLPVA